MFVEDFRTATWKRLKSRYEERLQELREMNDKDHDEKRTAAIRGQIAEVKALLALPSDGSAIKVDQPSEDWPGPGEDGE